MLYNLHIRHIVWVVQKIIIEFFKNIDWWCGEMGGGREVDDDNPLETRRHCRCCLHYYYYYYYY